QATQYAAEDADITLRLHRALYPDLARESTLDFVYADIEMPTARVLQRIERNGVLVDTAKLAAQSEEIGRRLVTLETEAYALAGQTF
ncbi:hypothetical protein, partial [Klebsiella pneumoniae]